MPETENEEDSEWIPESWERYRHSLWHDMTNILCIWTHCLSAKLFWFIVITFVGNIFNHIFIILLEMLYIIFIIWLEIHEKIHNFIRKIFDQLVLLFSNIWIITMIFTVLLYILRIIMILFEIF
jgi:hypothetical protein